ncbi:hypothetical protein ACFX15_000930 [Malus domestica]|uniref:uncharacterized protein n=1 Tax=Malus domestica TaxID=3750 RepID=UPI0010AA25F3|nr:uncharacterized protein LOC103423046 [Malus domestica]XP_028955762.1 uncharacterized protein LOC103423046 [Malus domestica]
MRNISSSSSTNTTTTTAQSVPDMVAAIRFHPTEDEKVDFLSKKMKSHNSQACLFLPFIDVRKFEPWELPEHMFPDSPHHAKAWYSFSPCGYKSINSRRFNRETKKGSWKMNSKQRDVGSKYFTCKKRTLTFQIKTFQEGSKSKSVPTGWKMHEYICIKPKRGSSPHQERDQQRDLVLCVLKYKPVDSKSNTGTSIRGDFADSTGNRGYIASSPGDDEAATAAAMNQDDGEPGGGSSSSDFINKSLCDMIQEWQSCAPAVECLNSFLPLHEQPQLGHSLDICSHELLDPGTGGCITYSSDNQAAATNHIIPDTEEILASKQLEGSAVLGSGNHDDGEPCSGISSDFNDHAVDDMQEFDQLDKLLDLPLSPPELSQPHQLENVPGVHSGKFSNWPSPIGVNTSYVTNKNNIATNCENEPVINVAFNSYNRATDERISEVYSQAEENLSLPFQPFDQPQNYTWQSPMLFSEVGELLHANNYIGCNESQFLDMEVATLFPQSS